MRRRDFLRVGAQTAVAASALGMTIDAVRAVSTTAGTANLLLPTDYLGYLRTLPEFMAIESIFNSYGPSRITISETLNSKRNNCLHLLTLNSTYGRFSNFSLEEFTERAAKDSSALNSLVVYTSGPSGRRLSEISPFTVVGRLTPQLDATPLVLDAYPHYYNSLLLGSLPRPTGLSYFIDTTTRKPIWLKLESKFVSKVIQKDRDQVFALISALQKKIDKIEQTSLARILEKTNRYDFSTVAALYDISKTRS